MPSHGSYFHDPIVEGEREIMCEISSCCDLGTDLGTIIIQRIHIPTLYLLYTPICCVGIEFNYPKHWPDINK